MFGNAFYHKTIKRIVTGFGTLFNDIWVVRTDNNNLEKNRIKVPIAYGPREKFLVRMRDDPSLQRPIDLVLPRLSFLITGYQYDGRRKLNTMGRNFKVKVGDNQHLLREFNPVPWNINFDLDIMTKTIDDGNQIVEQILPFFTPDYTITIDIIPSMGLKDDIPIVLNSMNREDTYDDEWKSRRNIVTTINFTAKAYFYGPIKEDPIITTSQIDSLVPPGVADLYNPADLAKVPRIHRHTVVPDPITANKDDDYGYTDTVEDFTDGKKYNPVTGNDEDIT